MKDSYARSYLKTARERISANKSVDLDYAIVAAAKFGDDSMVSLLLQKGAGNNVRWYLPIHKAAKYGHPSTVKILVEYGFDPNTALLSALKNNQFSVAQLLVEMGVCDKTCGKHAVPFIYEDRNDAAKFLATYFIEDREEFDCCVHAAAHHRTVDLVRYFLELGGRPFRGSWEFRKDISRMFVEYGFFNRKLDVYKYVAILDERHMEYVDDDPIIKRIIEYRGGRWRRMLSYPSDVTIIV